MPADLMTATTVLVALGLREVFVLAIRKLWKKTVATDYLPKEDFIKAMQEVVTSKDCSLCQKKQAQSDLEIKNEIKGVGKSIDNLRGMFLVVIMKSGIEVDDEVINNLAKRGS